MSSLTPKFFECEPPDLGFSWIRNSSFEEPCRTTEMITFFRRIFKVHSMMCIDDITCIISTFNDSGVHCTDLINTCSDFTKLNFDFSKGKSNETLHYQWGLIICTYACISLSFIWLILIFFKVIQELRIFRFDCESNHLKKRLSPLSKLMSAWVYTCKRFTDIEKVIHKNVKESKIWTFYEWKREGGGGGRYCMVETMTNYDVLPHVWFHYCAITLFEVFVLNQPAFRSFFMWFVLSCKALVFFWLASCFQNLGWAPQNGGQWGCFTTDLTKRAVALYVQLCVMTLNLPKPRSARNQPSSLGHVYFDSLSFLMMMRKLFISSVVCPPVVSPNCTSLSGG